MSYKLLGIQRGTEPCLTVFLHRAFLTASFQSKLSKWGCKSPQPMQSECVGLLYYSVVEQKDQFLFWQPAQLSEARGKVSLLSAWIGSGESSLHLIMHFISATGQDRLFMALSLTLHQWLEVRTPKISFLIFWWIAWLNPEYWSQSQGNVSSRAMGSLTARNHPCCVVPFATEVFSWLGTESYFHLKLMIKNAHEPGSLS